jgi:hypothetical protein
MPAVRCITVTAAAGAGLQAAAVGYKLAVPRTFQVACDLGYAVVVEQQHLQPRQAREALQPHDSIV